MCPTGQHGAISPHCELYAPPSLYGLNARLGSRPAVPSFRCVFLLSMSPFSSPESPSPARPQSFGHGFAFTYLSLRLGTPIDPLESASCGQTFRGFLVRSFATTCRVACLPGGPDRVLGVWGFSAPLLAPSHVRLLLPSLRPSRSPSSPSGILQWRLGASTGRSLTCWNRS